MKEFSTKFQEILTISKVPKKKIKEFTRVGKVVWQMVWRMAVLGEGWRIFSLCMATSYHKIQSMAFQISKYGIFIFEKKKIKNIYCITKKFSYAIPMEMKFECVFDQDCIFCVFVALF